MYVKDEQTGFEFIHQKASRSNGEQDSNPLKLALNMTVAICV
jgi:hypothetical protein